MRRLPQTRQRCARSPAWSRIWRTAGADGSEQGSLRRGGRAAVYRPICVRCASRDSGRCDAHGRWIMTGLLALWLPILVSAVLVFVVSSAIHMASPWHKSDYPKLSSEDRVMDALRPLAIPPGDYRITRPSSREEMRSPEFAAKVKQGPVMVLTVMPNGPMAMGRSLFLWFLYAAVVGCFAGYVSGRALPAGAESFRVFRFVGVTAFIGYSAALWQMSIWYRRAWTTTLKATVDGLIYALLTAGAFVWLWPH